MSDIIHLICAKCRMTDMVAKDLYKEWALACPARRCGGVYIIDTERTVELQIQKIY